MTASTAQLEVDDTLQVAVTDGGSRLAVQLDRDRALRVGATLIEFAMRSPGSTPGLSQTHAPLLAGHKHEAA